MRAALVLVACLLGCGEGRARPPPDAAPTPRVTVRVDGRAIGELAVTGEPRSLAEALPASAPAVESWRVVTARRPDRTMALGMEVYADHAIVVYVGDDGQPALGVYRRSPQGREQWRAVQSLARIDTIDIETTGAPEREDGPTLAIARGETVREVDVDRLARVPPAVWRSKKAQDRGPAWALADVVALAGPLAGIDHVELVAGDGARVVVPADQLPRALLRADPRALHAKGVGADGATVWRARDVRRIDVFERP